MQDFLVRMPSLALAKAALPAWVKGGNFQLPQWCDILPVDAYTDLGSPAVMSNDGLHTLIAAGVPPTLDASKWFIVSLDRAVVIPPAAQAAIQAQSSRDVPMQLPPGIKGLSTIWGGMLAPIPG